MKPMFTFLFCLVLIPFTFSQEEWQEHLSHDRTAYAHHGHLLNGFGNITLKMGNHTSPMNTTERIAGNVKKGIYWQATDINQNSDMKEYSFQSLRLGDEQSQVTLKAPLQSSFLANGVHSIILTHPQNVSLRKIDNPEVSPLNIKDVVFPLSLIENSYFITDDNKLYSLSFGYAIEWIEDFEGDMKLHNGLNSKAYKIHDGVFSKIENQDEGSLTLGEYDRLDNNPFNFELLVFNQNIISRYSYTDFSLSRTDEVVGIPIDHLFVEDGFYYMVESDLAYMIYFFSDETSQSEIYYELPKTQEIKDFAISEFNIFGDEVIFLGLWNAPHIKENFSYVQRRYVNQEYEPIRKDLEFSNMTAVRSPIGQDDQYEYEYKCTLTNLSEEPINYFTLYSQRLDLFDHVSDQFIKHDITEEIGPGESYEISGLFTYSELNSLSFHIAGVDFAVDSEMSNNSFTVEFGSVSSKEITTNEFGISPNPSTDYLDISGNTKDIQSISIIDRLGNVNKIQNPNSYRISTSELPSGQYWIQITTKTKTEVQPFIKY